jgi:ribosomal protein S18 acetylase RimI-like enzyme
MVLKYPKIIFKLATGNDYSELVKNKNSFSITVAKKMNLKNTLIFIARDKKTKELIGFCQVCQTNDGKLYIKAKAVKETATSKRVGRKMLGKLTAFAIQKGNTMLGVSSNSTFGSINFWLNKAKFRRNNDYHEYDFGKSTEGIFWRLRGGKQVLPEFLKHIKKRRK